MKKQKFITGALSVTALSALIFTSISPSYATPVQPRRATADCVPGQIVIELHRGADSKEAFAKVQELNGRIVDVATADGQTFALVQVNQPDKNWYKAFTAMAKDKSHFDIVQLNNHYYRAARRRPAPPPRKPPAPTPPKPPVTPPPTTPPPSGTGWPTSGNPDDTNLSAQTQLFVHNVIPGQRAIFSKGKAMPVAGGVKIGIIDTGVQGSLSCFASGQVLSGRNVVTNGNGNVDSDKGSFGGHGTFCASLMAATANDKSTGAGILPGATIVPVDCFNGSTSTDSFKIIKGIQYLQTISGLKYVNLSVNGEPPNTLNTDASYRAACQTFNSVTGGCIFNAAGNSGGTDSSSQAVGNVVVEAVNSSRSLASFSVRGSAIQLAGLGVSDGAMVKSGKFVVGDGTSFATPSVCAIAAAIQYTKGLSLAETLSLMKSKSNAASNGVPVPDMNLCITAP